MSKYGIDFIYISQVSEQDKLRLLLIYVISQEGIAEGAAPPRAPAAHARVYSKIFVRSFFLSFPC